MIVHSSDISTDPHDSVRADLWHTMTPSMLYRQQELLTDRVIQLRTLMSSTAASPTVYNMLTTTQQALERLNAIVERTAQGNVNS